MSFELLKNRKTLKPAFTGKHLFQMEKLMNFQKPIVSTIKTLLLIAASAFAFAACSMHDETPEPVFYNGGGSADATTKTDGAAVTQITHEDAFNGTQTATATTKVDGSDIAGPQFEDGYNGETDDSPITKTDADVLPNDEDFDALPDGDNPGVNPQVENAEDLFDPTRYDAQVNGFEGNAKAKDKADGKDLPKPAQISR